MTRKRIFQAAGVSLVLLCVFVFFKEKAFPPSSTAITQRVETPSSTSQQEGRSSIPDQTPVQRAPTSPAAASEAESIVSRDPFQLPPMLQEALRQRALAKAAALAKRAENVSQATLRQPIALKLQGILWEAAQPRAIVNRKIVAVGDTIQDAQVTAIDKEGVTVSFNGQEYRLKLPTKNSLEEKQPWPDQQAQPMVSW